MRKTFLVGIRAVLATGLFSIVTTISVPVLPQEAEEDAATESPVFVESTIVGGADPTTASTVGDLTIPVDELKLQVKPLSLEELQAESAAWFLILKEKAQEIADTEVAIRRGNRVIDIQAEASTAITDAESQLAAAEADLEAATPNTPEYEKAAERVEAAKESLNEAKQVLDEAIEANQELREDEALQETLETAAAEEEAGAAQEFLKEAKDARDKLEAGSDEYNEATEKIDALDQALVDLEDVEEDLDSAVPESPEYKEAETELEKIRAEIDKAVDALVEAGLVELDEEDKDDVEAEDAAALLEELAEDVEDAEEAADVEEIEDADAEADGEEAEAEGGETEAEAEGEEPEAEAEVEGSETEDAAATSEEEVEAEVEEAESAAEGLEEAAEQLDALTEEDAELKNQLVANVTELQGEQTAIIDRFNTVLDELDRKGGDSTSYRSYIAAATAIEIDVTDTTGLGVRVWTWIKSEEGGLRWAISIVKFVAILGVAAAASRVLSSVAKKTLAQFDAISNLFQGFLVMVVERGTLVVGFLIALTSLGISLGPLLALFGGLSFILAFALQSNLGNFASGLMLLFYKPFDVGNYVVIPGTPLKGFVREITLANTSFNHYDGRIVTVPNSVVWSSSIQNLVPGEDRLIEFMFVISSNDNSPFLVKAWDEAVEEHPGTNKEKWYMGMPFVDAWNGGIYFWAGAFAKHDGKFWDTYIELYDDFIAKIEGTGITLGTVKHENIAYMLDSSAMSEGLIPKDPKANLASMISREVSSKGHLPEGADPGVGPDFDM